jgi:hypothetical protein
LNRLLVRARYFPSRFQSRWSSKRDWHKKRRWPGNSTNRNVGSWHKV